MTTQKAINLILIILLHIQTACGQQKDQNTPLELEEMKNDNIVFDDQAQTGYFLQINNQNCHYKILVNDFLGAHYIDEYPAYSVRPMINFDILRSGTQTLSIIITPLIGDTLSSNADLTIQLLRYENMVNKEDFGGSSTILEWEMPPIDKDNPIPSLRFDTTFHAEVPYELNTINYAEDLTEIKQDDLLKEVVSQFKTIHSYIKNDYDKLNAEYAVNKLNKLMATKYYSKAEALDIYRDNKESFQSEEYSSTLQPIENYKLALYGNGRVATLERLADEGRIIWCKDKETGEEIASLPIFIYKDIRDNQWHLW